MVKSSSNVGCHIALRTFTRKPCLVLFLSFSSGTLSSFLSFPSSFPLRFGRSSTCYCGTSGLVAFGWFGDFGRLVVWQYCGPRASRGESGGADGADLEESAAGMAIFGRTAGETFWMRRGTAVVSMNCGWSVAVSGDLMGRVSLLGASSFGSRTGWIGAALGVHCGLCSSSVRTTSEPPRRRLMPLWAA